MTIVSTGYAYSSSFNDPGQWLGRIRFYTCILEALANEHEVHSIEQINHTGFLVQDGVQYHFLPPGTSRSGFPSTLHRYIGKIKPEVVLVNGFISPFRIMQLKWMLGRNVKILVINRAERPGTGLRKWLQRMASRSVHRYLFTSKAMGADWIQEGIFTDSKKIAAVIGASSSFRVMDKEPAQIKTQASGSPVFLFVGRLDANKDPLTVLRAFGRYAIEQPDARLYMVYQTEALLEDINKLVQSEPALQKAVVLVGSVPHQVMEDWYNSADFIISASHYEGSGVAVCEAMSCGCIPILSDIPSFRAMTGEGSCGFLYPPGNPEALLALLLHTKTINREQEKEKTLRQFRKELSSGAIAAKIEAIIAE